MIITRNLGIQISGIEKLDVGWISITGSYIQSVRPSVCYLGTDEVFTSILIGLQLV